MNVEIFAEWLRRQGHYIVRTASSLWYDAGPRVYEAFPFHWTIQPSEQELEEFLTKERAVGLRYSSPVDVPQGKASYHVIFDRGPYDLEVLSANTRSRVRRGLKRCKVERISMERLAQEGWRLQQDTLERQGRSRHMNQDQWQRMCLAARGLPGFEAWGAIVQGDLAATILTACVDDTCKVLSAQSHRQYFNSYVNNAVSYIMSHEVLSRPGIRMVFYSPESLDAPASVDEFKFQMGYTTKPVRQRIVFHPWLAPVFNNATHAVLKQLLRWYPNYPTLSKAEGLLRFYLEGNRPLNEQNWPERLTHLNEELA
ncbi:MAG: hypothetical protein KJ077_06805 [Anaerolineae bacterium]|nr:hypothetical protein [Anaerolineae bacterium]